MFLDSSHPEQWERLAENGLFEKRQITLLKSLSILADMGILGVYNEITNTKPKIDNLPKDCQVRKLKFISYSGDVYRRYLKANIINNDILLRAGQSSELDSLPVLVFTAKKQYGDPEMWFEM